MKRFIVLFMALMVMLSLCSCSFLPKFLPDILPDRPGAENSAVVGKPESSENESGKEEEFDPSAVDLELKADFDEASGNETASVIAKDKDGKVLWTHNCGSYPAMQLENFTEIGKKGDKYFYSEGGKIVALSCVTGELLWKNSDFDGFAVKHVFGEDAIYLCGYFGPDFFAVSYGGATLKRIATLDNNYWGARDIALEGRKIAVTFDSSEDGNGGTLYLNAETYGIIRD